MAMAMSGLGAQGGFLSHADAEFHPSLDVGLALRGLRWEIRQVDFHGQNGLLRTAKKNSSNKEQVWGWLLDVGSYRQL